MKELFERQCQDILASDAYSDVFRQIAQKANAELRADDSNGRLNIERKRLDTLEGRDDAIRPDMPVDELEEHLIAQFPPQFVTTSIAGREWSIRIRASATACAIEDKNREPKLWWSFESVPTDPDPDNRPAEDETAAVFQFAESFEDLAFENLSRAYFDALKGKLGEESGTFDFAPVVGADKVNILFADSKSFRYETLIDAIGYQKLTPKEIVDEAADDLVGARDGLNHFKSLVRQAVPADDELDLDTVELKCPPMPRGLDALTAVVVHSETGSKSIIGIAQSPVPRSSLHDTPIGRDLRVAENAEPRLRFASAARQVTARIAEAEAVQQEVRRRNSAAAIHALNVA